MKLYISIQQLQQSGEARKAILIVYNGRLAESNLYVVKTKIKATIILGEVLAELMF
jgi:hypothetical protein